MIVDCAVYTDGRRRAGALRLDEALQASKDPGSFVWIEIYEPTPQELDAVRAELDLHELAVEDALTAHQRPKLEVFGDDLFVVLKTARYLDASETVRLAEIQLFVGATYVVTVRHGEASDLAHVRAEIERDVDRMRCGPLAVLHAVIDRVVDDYHPVIVGLDNDLAEIEDAVFDPARPRGFDPSQRIFKLKREVLELYRNTEPFLDPLARLAGGQVPNHREELASYFRDVEDHLTRTVTSLAQLRDLLTDALDANIAQVTVRQNDDMRTISAWLAIAGVPTVGGAIYGMNFQHMPELEWTFGYPAAMAVMAAACLALHRRFKQIGWL